MKALDRYIFREISLFFALSLSVFVFVLLLGKTLSLAELVVIKGVGPGQVLKLSLLLIPPFLVIAVPMALLAATSIAFSRLSTDNEILIMKVCGHGPIRLMASVAVFSLLSLAAALSMSLYFAPASHYLFRSSLFSMVTSKAGLDIKEKVFNNFFDGLLLYADEVIGANRFLRGVLISDTRAPEDPRIIVAQEGVVVGDKKAKQVFIRLRNGSIHPGTNDADQYSLITFQQYDIQLDLKKSLSESANAARRGKEMSLGEIRAEMEKLDSKSKSYRQILMEYHKRFAIPASTLFLGFIGAMIGVTNKRSGRLGGFSTALAVILAYYLLFMGGEGLSNEGKIPPFWAAWAPNFFVVGTALAALSFNSEWTISLIEKRSLLIRLGKFLRR